MPSKPDGGPAFPESYSSDNSAPNDGIGGGMSLRAYFAGQALSQLADCDAENEQEVAQYCVSIADALIEELEK